MAAIESSHTRSPFAVLPLRGANLFFDMWLGGMFGLAPGPRPLDHWLGPWSCLDPNVAPLVLFGPKSGGSQSEMSCFLKQTWTPGWPPDPVWTQKWLFSIRNGLFSRTDLDPWLCPWSCLVSKVAVLNQK